MLTALSKPRVVRMPSKAVRRLLDMKYPSSHTHAWTCEDPAGEVEWGGQLTHVVKLLAI